MEGLKEIDALLAEINQNLYCLQKETLEQVLEYTQQLRGEMSKV